MIRMADHGECKIIAADMMNGAVLITFADGRLAIYSAALLRSILPLAQEVEDMDPDLDPDLDPNLEDEF